MTITSLSMRELGKLSADQVSHLDRPVPVTSSGKPIAWLVPLSESERRRAEMIAAGTLRPRRKEDLGAWSPLPASPGEPPLSELLAQCRDQERT
jgi:antitoxin (DNA-binding transcriptional repressor) of toxin-antitoxin stability system